jgi:predicted nucleic acid-binding Zn ribbon protein
MERASRVITRLGSGGKTIDAEGVVRAAWPAAVGRKIAARARAARMVRTRLIVEVEDSVWRRQLFTLSGQILANLEKRLGRGVVEDLEFRVIPARREAQRAETAQPAPAGSDEADQIADPVLRHIYKHSRKKALA